jgi:hypothetical protein
MAIFGYDQDAWEKLSPEQRLQAFLNQPGHSDLASSLQKQQIENPDVGTGLSQLANNSGNYADDYLRAIANNSSKLPVARPASLPSVESGIGVMSGDASADIAEGYRQTVQKHGPDPRQNKNVDPNQAQEWEGHLGQEVGDVTGMGPYKTQYDEQGRPIREWKAITKYHPAFRGY